MHLRLASAKHSIVPYGASHFDAFDDLRQAMASSLCLSLYYPSIHPLFPSRPIPITFSIPVPVHIPIPIPIPISLPIRTPLPAVGWKEIGIGAGPGGKGMAIQKALFQW